MALVSDKRLVELATDGAVLKPIPEDDSVSGGVADRMKSEKKGSQ